MAKEIERKFLVSGEGWRSEVESSARLQQFYLVAGKGRSVRIRIEDGVEAKLTMKFGMQARMRDEFEYAIPLAEAEEMRGFAVGRIIEKTRNIVRHKGRRYEVDIFGGALDGLTMAELETAEEVPGDDLPSWLGREVTGESAYYNASLALDGLPAEKS